MFVLKGLGVFLILCIVLLVLLQDFLIFPGLKDGISQKRSSDYQVPEGVEERFLQTPDKTKLETWTLNIPDSRDILAIILTGNADTLRQGGHYYQQWFESLRIPSIAFSYRGYGKSSGWPSEEGLKEDADTVHRFAKEKFPDKKILVFAVSIGTGPGTWLAMNREVGGLILVSPYSNLKKLASEMPLYGWLTPFMKYEFDSLGEIEAAKSPPCAVIVHGLRDQIIPASHSLPLYEALNSKGSKAKRLTYENAGHNDVMGFAMEDLVGEMERCF